MKKIILTNEQLDTILKNNYSPKQIKTYLNVSYATVRTLCAEYKIIPSADRRIYTVDDNYFKTWTIEMAYFLGLISADGHVRSQNNQLSLSLQEKDKQIVDNLRIALNYTGYLYKINKKDGQPQSALTVTSKEIVNDLHNLGLSGNKTYDFDWIIGMPDKFVSHFCRGLFDGDGCVHLNEIKRNFVASIVGTYKLTKNIKDYFNKLSNNTAGSLQPKGNVQNLEFNGRYNALAFLNWIYNESTPETRLERKYDLYLRLKDIICEDEQVPNNSHINQKIANTIRKKYTSGLSVKQISDAMEIPEATIYDVVQNRSWKDESYEHTKKKQDTIYITWNGKSQTIKEWSKELNIPYTTIDRRYRQNLPIDQVMSVEQLDKTKKVQSNKDKAAYELAKLIREDYKNGIIGKANYDKYNVKKSRYIDLIGNRTCKEDCVWWKN